MMLDSPYGIYMTRDSTNNNPYSIPQQNYQNMGYNQGANQYPQQFMPQHQQMYQQQPSFGQQSKCKEINYCVSSYLFPYIL